MTGVRSIAWRLGLIVGKAVLWLAASGSASAGQSTWELTPYRVQVLIAFGSDPGFTPDLQADLQLGLKERADRWIGATWNLTLEVASRRLQQMMTTEPERIDWESLPDASRKYDKVMLMAVTSLSGDWQVRVRELDLRVRQWGPTVLQPVWQPSKLCDTALGAMLAAFSPLARVDHVDRQKVELRVQASGLRARDPQVLRVRVGDLFRPVLCDEDRKGNPARIVPVAWTYCVVERAIADRVECRLHTGLRSPLSVRQRRQRQQLAIGIVAQDHATEIRLLSRSGAKRPLAGYEVFVQPPDGKTATRLGVTNWQGQLLVPPAKPSLQILLVRSGNELLARLPIVAGVDRSVSAEIPDDAERLEAEGLIGGLQEELVDLVTRREVLLKGAKARIHAKKFDEAQALLDELSRLPTARQFGLVLSEQKNRLMAKDRTLQPKIDALLGDTQQLVAKHLDGRTIEELRESLHQARRAGGPGEAKDGL